MWRGFAAFRFLFFWQEACRNPLQFLRCTCSSNELLHIIFQLWYWVTFWDKTWNRDSSNRYAWNGLYYRENRIHRANGSPGEVHNTLLKWEIEFACGPEANRYDPREIFNSFWTFKHLLLKDVSQFIRIKFLTCNSWNSTHFHIHPKAEFFETLQICNTESKRWWRCNKHW